MDEVFRKIAGVRMKIPNLIGTPIGSPCSSFLIRLSATPMVKKGRDGGLEISPPLHGGGKPSK
jgi:hypothetical protein